MVDFAAGRVEGGAQLPEAFSSPERRLWAAVLELLIKDGLEHWRGKTDPGNLSDREQAFDDLTRCGPMTRHCCDHLNVCPYWLSRKFTALCEDMAGSWRGL